ncbi:integrase [Vibrio coralliirubri]|uniref:integrase n=1 Tax=Vibrio coralliirubri TaxID=1516159 RepID=UPI000632EB55|nr:integrase [Vibrio coralliirubri]CDT25316.1 conserved hypothetical protein [Vibrio coralliirubri]
MSENVFLFKPKAELTAEANLERFINKSKQLSVFGLDKWHENKWDTVKGTSTVVARFSTNREPSNSYTYQPLASPFLDFAKAYIKYTYSHKPVTNLQRHFEAIRILEEALLEATGTADILNLDGVVLGRLDEFCKKRLSNATALNKAGYQVQLLLDFCRSNLITPSLPEWSNPYGKKKDLTVAIDDEGKEYRADKLPDDDDMMLVAKLFSNAPELGVEVEYYTAVMALLMCAPARCSEPTVLPVNCEVWEENRAGDLKLGLQWVPAKKGKVGVKWIPTVMQDVAIEAIKRLKRIGEKAREAALFAEEQPNKFMRHSGCITPEGFSDTSSLSLEQFNAAMSVNLKGFTLKAPTPKWLINILEENDGVVTYEALGKYEYSRLRKKFKKWPYADKAKHVKVSDCLFLHRENEFHNKFKPRSFSSLLPTVNQVNDRFIQKESRDGMSLWSKFEISKPDGSFIQIPSHDARHWLSTMCERGGMDELVIANWAGRAKVSDNKSYDHRTEEEKSDEMAMLLDSEHLTPLDKIKLNLPVSYEDIGKDLAGCAIVTELGVCEHDFSMLPCTSNGDCETCKELVCIKGMENSLDNLKKREIEVASQLKKSQDSREMGVFGADRWISAHGWRLSHIRTKIRILEDENTPDGTPVRIPEEYDPSPVKEALREKGFGVDIESPETIGIQTDGLVLEGTAPEINDEELGLADEVSDLFDMMEDL